MKEKLYDLTAPQKSILVTEQYFKGSSINHICGTAFLYEKIDFDVLEQALNLLVKYNDSLRIRMVLEENEMRQTVNEYVPFNIETVEVSSKDEVSTIEANLMKEPFDMYSNLFTCKMFRMPDGSGGFSVNIHHLVSDSWTLGLVAKEVVRIYSSIIHHEEIDVSSISSYVDYISAEQEYRASDKFKKDKAYWDSVFENIPESASIPSSKEDADSFSCKANRLSFTISKKEMEQINTYCKDAHISAFNFFMGLYAIYTSRVSGIEDFVMGTPILNRTNFKEKNTMGMFINVVPLRMDLTENQTFKDFASKIAKSSFEMLRHQKYSYQYILEDIRKRDASLPNLYHILMSYQITKTSEESGVPYDTRWAFNGNVNDDLEIHLYDLNDTGCIDIAYDYRSDKYEESEIRAVHERVLHMIHQVLERKDIGIHDIEIVTSKEKYEILYGFNDTDADYPRDKTIVDLFEEQVEKTPDNVAVVFAEQRLTYRELNERANQLAHYLIRIGIKPNDVVALRMPKCLEMIIGILGIVKAGATYLPINLSYPQERVDFMLKDSNATYFLYCPCKESINISIPKLDISMSNLDIYSLPTENPNSLNVPEDVIYIIYTSGSTGTPKGAMLMHKNVVRLLKNSRFQFDFNEDDVWTMFHSVAFDFSVWEMYGALLFGGKLVLVPEEVAQDPSRFLALLRNEKVTVLNQTPTYFYNLLDVEMLSPEHQLSIRYIIFGGEALNPLLISNWKEFYPFTKLINMYGITETTVHVTFKELTREDLMQTSSNIGTPIPTLKVYVMDKNQKLLPYGTPGELCVAGLGLCKGYLNRPELNISRFVQNPYLPNERLYRSADTAILLESGELLYKGRIDNQVKIRGFRIELGEIEAKLSTYFSVEKCIVLPKIVDNKDAFLVAYIICNSPTTYKELKTYISQLVPSYMVPTHFIFVDSFPLTNNGKIDRKKLLSMDLYVEKRISYIPPRNSFESTFVSILEKTLPTQMIGIDDNILELGVDSLTLMKITVELLQNNYVVNIQDIYELKTVRLISDKINYHQKFHHMLSNHLYYSFDESFNSKKILPNNILLTGATGYLGIHILYDLLSTYDCTIFCLIRKKDNFNPKVRLLKKLEYYFGKDILHFIDTRIQVINGDISLPNLGLQEQDYISLGKKIDMVIHCAAIVSHYGDKSLFDTINVNATNSIISFCQKFDAKLNYISTTSVCAYHANDKSDTLSFDEHCLYIGQEYEGNIYIKSKFEAECHVWEAMKNGLKACVYRLGNITARYSDGKFQENDTQNAFLNRIVAFTKLSKIPISFANLSIDLSPVDICSNIIVHILNYSSSYGKVFHIYNNNTITVNTLLTYIETLGKHIEIVSDSDFNNLLLHLHEKEDALGIINDVTSNVTMQNTNIILNSDFTTQYIKNIGIQWPIIELDYIEKFLNHYIQGG